MADDRLRAGVMGKPVAHSRSPMIHRHWLKEHGISGSYDPFLVEPVDAADFIAGLRASGRVGCNVTIPHKEVAFATVRKRTAVAEAIGAVNTVWYDKDVLSGTNTDAFGFAANLDDFARGWDNGTKAAVIGAGGASRAIVHALLERGFSRIEIVNRTPERALELAAMFGPKVHGDGWAAMGAALDGADLVVNTTSLGMEGQGDMDIDLSPVPDHAIVTDIVYVPLITPFLKSAAARDLKTVDGLGMLLHQAVPGFELWFGVRPQVTPLLRALIMADMEAHA